MSVFQSSNNAGPFIVDLMTRTTLAQTDTWDLAEYREAFALFDKRGTGQVPRNSLGELVRSLGQNPTQAEVSQLEQNVGATCPSSQQERFDKRANDCTSL